MGTGSAPGGMNTKIHSICCLLHSGRILVSQQVVYSTGCQDNLGDSLRFLHHARVETPESKSIVKSLQYLKIPGEISIEI